MQQYFVYIMTNRLKTTVYIGVTNDLVRRAYQHKNHHLEGFTDHYNCERLVYFEAYGEVKTAIAREKQLKGWRRQKKNDLIDSVNPNWRDLSADVTQ